MIVTSPLKGLIFKLMILILTGAFLIPLTANHSSAGYEFNLSISDKESGFSFSVSNYYRVPEREVIIIRERGIEEDELPVVFFIAKRARVSPDVIIRMRLSGYSWMDISLHFGIGPEVYYVPVKETVIVGPPYGKAYGHYKKYPRHRWHMIRLDDDDIVNLVNLRFISEYYGIPPHEVIKMRAEGKRFVVMDKELKEKKGRHKEEKDKGKGKGKGHE